jgi:hypothetical protein
MCLLLLVMGCVQIRTALASSGASQLGIADDMDGLESDTRKVLRYVLIAVGATSVILAASGYHAGLFGTIAMVLVVIWFAGKGITAAVDRTGLAEGATISRSITPDDVDE